jgi:hypothetical protein
MCPLLRSGFCLATTIKSAAEMVVLLEDSTISTEELWSSVTDHRVLGHLPDQGPSPPIAQFGQSSKSFGGSKLLQFLKMEATVYLGTFNAAEKFWYLSPDLCLNTILSQSSMDNSFDLMAWVLL